MGLERCGAEVCGVQGNQDDLAKRAARPPTVSFPKEWLRPHWDMLWYGMGIWKVVEQITELAGADILI